MNKRYILKMLFVIAFFPLLSAQQSVEGIAVAGGNGIFVHTGNELLFKEDQNNDAIAYVIERKGSNSEWESIAERSAPATFNEFLLKVDKYKNILPDRFEISDSVLNDIWENVKKWEAVDSLGFWSAVLPLRLALGLSYYDSSAIENVQYEYRISKKNVSGETIESILSEQVKFPGKAYYPKINFSMAEVNEQRSMIKWKYIGDLAPASFSIFRKDNINGKFRKINCRKALLQVDDSLIFAIQDETIAPKQSYAYFIMPYDGYGNSGNPSDTAIVHTISSANIYTPLDVRAESSNEFGGLVIKWKVPQPELYQSIKIMKTEDWNAEPVEIADVGPEDTMYVDQAIKPAIRYYYSLIGVLISGEKLSSTPKVIGLYESDITPLAPENLKSTGTNNGVTLEWQYKYKDINGFYVYRNDPKQKEYRLITSLIPADTNLTNYSFTDTSSVLSGKYSYKYFVRADSRSSIQGLNSDTVMVRPDKITEPLTPMITDVLLNEQSAIIYWEAMSEIDYSISGYNLYRKVDEGEWEKLNGSQVDYNINSFTDNLLEEGKKYRYAIESVDIYNSKSRLGISDPVELQTEIPPAPKEVTVEKNENGVLIRWSEVINSNLEKYKIIRFEQDGSEKLVSEVEAGKLEFVDETVMNGNLYFYFIQTKLKNGRESRPGKEVSIRY